MCSEANAWANINSWENVLPPSRPAIWQLYETAKLCQSSKLENVAVLGSTIEFRDMFAELGARHIYVFEKNVSFYEKISKLKKYNVEEIMINGDWVETLGQYNNYFDIILSDLTSGNIPYDKREKFYHDIAYSLKNDGRFIDRVLTKNIPYLDKTELIEKYSRKELTLRNVNDFNCEMIFCSSLLEDTDGILNTSRIYDKLLALNNSRITEFVNACYKVTPRDCTWWYSIWWNLEKQVILRNLSLEKSFDEPMGSPYYKRVKMFVFRRRQKT